MTAGVLVCTRCFADYKQCGKRALTPLCPVCRKLCVLCEAPRYSRHTDRCETHRRVMTKQAGSPTLNLRYEDDVAAQLFVDAFPNGGTTREVAEALGISRHLVNTIEHEALRHFRRRLRLVGIDMDDVMPDRCRLHPLAEIAGGAW